MTAPTLERLDHLIAGQQALLERAKKNNGITKCVAFDRDIEDTLAALQAYRETLKPATSVYNINQFACGQYNSPPDISKLYFGPEGRKS